MIIYSLIQLTFVEHLFYARHCVKHEVGVLDLKISDTDLALKELTVV